MLFVPFADFPVHVLPVAPMTVAAIVQCGIINRFRRTCSRTQLYEIKATIHYLKDRESRPAVSTIPARAAWMMVYSTGSARCAPDAIAMRSLLASSTAIRGPRDLAVCAVTTAEHVGPDCVIHPTPPPAFPLYALFCLAGLAAWQRDRSVCAQHLR